MAMVRKQLLQDPVLGMMSVQVRRSARSIRITVRDGMLHVITPPFASSKALLRAIAPLRETLLEKLSAAPPPFDWNYRIESECFRLWLEPSKLKHFTVRTTESGVKVCCPASTDFSDAKVQTLVRNAVTRAMKKKAEEYLPPLVQVWAERFGLTYHSVKISKARTRWGSCSSRKNINLSLYMMLLPAHLMDYVVLHELAHTEEMNHGVRFWELLDKMTGGQALSLRKELRMFIPQF